MTEFDRSAFYASLRKRDSGVFGTSLSQGQVDGIEAILDEAEKRGTQLDYLAYMLATVYHETAHTMQPIEEYGKGKGREYGQPDGPYGKVYYGRGFVQLTWLFNYEKASKKLGVDFVRYPELVMDLKNATAILFDGMAEGWFTGKSLSDYLDGVDEPDAEDLREFSNARRIINGTDKQVMIGKYALAFETALKAGGYTAKAVEKSPQKPAQSDPPPDAPTQPETPPSAWAAFFMAAIKAIAKALGGKK
ncbi:hypothetical protein JET14_13175 [Martelella lutilitoris]|uniref:Glycoside hydrolase family 19 catalytic domain-containing protein n=1 Tax=Martelella lutilitoris TaxID=2583532 RepID=A0A7T7HHM0_9HYPH|nr:glycoside hydrolase family 19 protein [Martelella lutilitoris]QQM29279.1 hypothetical protein JET14_13175 [Martelella lutilitoris]